MIFAFLQFLMNLANVSPASMTNFNYDLAVAQAIALIKSYSFDTNGTAMDKLVQKWLSNYQRNWVRLAAIEALYLGRYKTVSMEQIMEVWLRIGTPNVHFTGEFERLICRQLPKHLVFSDTPRSESEESLFLASFNKTTSTDQLQHREFSYSAASSAKTLSDIKTILKRGQGRTGEQETGSPKGLASVSRGDKGDSSENYDFPSHSPTITNFHPVLDNSSFFDKLKSLAMSGDRSQADQE